MDGRLFPFGNHATETNYNNALHLPILTHVYKQHMEIVLNTGGKRAATDTAAPVVVVVTVVLFVVAIKKRVSLPNQIQTIRNPKWHFTYLHLLSSICGEAEFVAQICFRIFRVGRTMY